MTLVNVQPSHFHHHHHPTSPHQLNAPNSNFLNLSQVLKHISTQFVHNVPYQDRESLLKLFFHIERGYWFYLDYYMPQNKKLPYLSFKQFVLKLFDTCDELRPHKNQVQEIFKKFLLYKFSLPVVGTIIFNENYDKILMVQNEQTKNYGFPKGKVNENEEYIQTAIRETREEIGRDISEYILEDQYIDVQNERKHFRLYFTRGIPDNYFNVGRFNAEYKGEIHNIQWFPLEYILTYIRHKNFHLHDKINYSYSKFNVLVRHTIPYIDQWSQGKISQLPQGENRIRIRLSPPSTRNSQYRSRCKSSRSL